MHGGIVSFKKAGGEGHDVEISRTFKVSTPESRKSCAAHHKEFGRPALQRTARIKPFRETYACAMNFLLV
jgi:hypothetical protein